MANNKAMDLPENEQYSGVWNDSPVVLPGSDTKLSGAPQFLTELVADLQIQKHLRGAQILV